MHKRLSIEEPVELLFVEKVLIGLHRLRFGLCIDLEFNKSFEEILLQLHRLTEGMLAAIVLLGKQSRRQDLAELFILLFSC